MKGKERRNFEFERVQGLAGLQKLLATAYRLITASKTHARLIVRPEF